MTRRVRLKQTLVRWRENTRSLVTGEEPRYARAYERTEPGAWHVSATGVVVGVEDTGGTVVLVDLLGEWSLVELDEALFPLGAESSRGEALVIALDRSLIDIVEEALATQRPLAASSVVRAGGELVESSARFA